MNHQPSDNPRLRELIDACRPGSDDLDAPEMRELAGALQRQPKVRDLCGRMQVLDANVSAAVHDVPVPEGLADRLLARLLSSTPTAEQDAGPRTAGEIARAERPGGGSSRRRLVSAIVGLALAASVALVVYVNWPRPQPVLTRGDVEQGVYDFHLSDKPGGGRPLPGPPAYAYADRDLAVVNGITWRRVHLLGDAGAVAYDIPHPMAAGIGATLYVIDVSVENLPSSPLPAQRFNTGGVSVVAWQASQRVYVLVVPGDGDARDYLKPPAEIAATFRPAWLIGCGM